MRTKPEISIFQAIRSLVPDAELYVEDNKWDRVNYVGDYGGAKPTKEEVDAEIVKLQAASDAQEYARNRQAKYPTIQELVVALYDTDDKSAVEAKRAAVKLKYPKP